MNKQTFAFIAPSTFAPSIRIEDSYQLMVVSEFEGKKFMTPLGSPDIDREFIEAKRAALAPHIGKCFIKTIRQNKQFPRPFGTQGK